MEQRFLGRTGLRVSELCLGAMTFGRESPEDVSVQMANHFVEQGGTLISEGLPGYFGDRGHVGKVQPNLGTVRPGIFCAKRRIDPGRRRGLLAAGSRLC